jgi:hypothetical protein
MIRFRCALPGLGCALWLSASTAKRSKLDSPPYELMRATSTGDRDEIGDDEPSG